MSKIRQIFLLVALFVVPLSASAEENMAERLAGRMLLQVESRGAAWYVSPVNEHRYHLGTPKDALNVMSELGLGITNADLEKIPTADNIHYGYMEIRRRVAGRILLQVETDGTAWYVDPVSLLRSRLGSPSEAFAVLRSHALGITDADIAQIPEGRTGRKTVLHSVPFVPQAPFAEWDDIRQQEACEESSTLMAIGWAHNTPLAYGEARNELLAMSDWQYEKWGYYHDTSIQDTADRLFREYFGFTDIEVVSNITTEDIRNALEDGHIVVTAINGRAIGNPYFSDGGPLRHMIVIAGYDMATDEFIVNDPGTKRGKSIRYSVEAIANSLRDYPSGRYVPIPSDAGTAMIVVKKPTE